MYREEPLNRKLDRLKSNNDVLKERIKELEDNGTRIVNVWNLNWGNINWPTIIAVAAVVLSGLLIQAQMQPTDAPVTTAVEVEQGEVTIFRPPPTATPPTTESSRINWTTFYPPYWVLSYEELDECYWHNNDCRDDLDVDDRKGL